MLFVGVVLDHRALDLAADLARVPDLHPVFDRGPLDDLGVRPDQDRPFDDRERADRHAVAEHDGAIGGVQDSRGMDRDAVAKEQARLGIPPWRWPGAAGSLRRTADGIARYRTGT